MLVKPRPKEQEAVKQEIKPKQSRRQVVCNKCHKSVTYKEITVPIQYGFNCKQSVFIDGIERVCSVCGWHVDDIETTKLNREIAKKSQQ